jgi:UDP:flavonoid glycosyltransferase YjiC (YdhE family)
LVQYAGPIIVRDRNEVFQRDEARSILGIPSDKLAIYVTAGGGGDKNAERLLRRCRDLLEEVRDVHLVIGAGPLYRGRCFYSPRITWLSQGPAVEYLNGFDIAVSAAGYNSFNELMHFGVPAVILPQEKWADDQYARAERAARAGAGLVLDSNSDDFGSQLIQTIGKFRDLNARLAASEAGRNLVPQNHASEAALALLKLLRS